MSPRELSLDGSLHIEGDCCRNCQPCRSCGAVQHYQGIYGGYMEVCEQCPRDAELWEPAGTYCRECECSKVQCELRNCAWKM